ncbi:sulfate adenylyltransferase [Candidatus Poribacteria bacterium]|nr:sulfate adenylyltransferase [Candidatus Poribacteria bacterium]
MKHLIDPHGGKLINSIGEGPVRDYLIERIPGMEKVTLNKREISDLEMISIGAFSPLEGFMGQKDYNSVLENNRLASGCPWTIPITLAVSKDDASKYALDNDVALCDQNGEVMGVLYLDEKYDYDREKEAQVVYGTTDIAHPGVAALYEKGDVLLAGNVVMINRPDHGEIEGVLLDPKETRLLFHYKGWSSVVAFQTRNPIHRAHEYIQKCALETVDGLLLHPLVGATKKDDIPADVRIECYRIILEKYYPKNRTVMSVFPAAMRYAGPKEAILHAIARKNYGCTHFIVGRDHAGVANYYGTYDAQKIFDEFKPEEIGIIPLKFEHAFYCKECDGMATGKTCPHGKESHVFLSGTKVRGMLSEGKDLPEEFTRPEVAQILMKASRGVA